MANKKISQLTSIGTVGIGTDDYFVTAESLGAGNYSTVKSSALQVSEYVLNPISAAQISGENKNVYFDNDSWDTASNTVTQNPYLQVRVSDGKLVTGSGIANAVGGDNMGNGVATTNINTQGFSVSGLGKLGFGNVMSVGGFDRSHIKPDIHGHGTDLEVVGYQDLTLSGNRHVNISGQAIDVANTPFSGNVNVTGGNLEVDPSYKLRVSEIEGVGNPTVGIVDANAAVSIKGAFRSVPYQFDVSNGSLYQVDWSDSNIQYVSANNIANIDFYNSLGGQTLTLYITNTAGSDLNPNFRSGSFADNLVRWGADGNDPTLKAGKTNVYTFVNINQRIFASAITGYVY